MGGLTMRGQLLRPARSLTRRCLSTYPGIRAAVLLERRPIIYPDPLPIEEEFDEIQHQIYEIRCRKYPNEVFAAAIAEDQRAEKSDDPNEEVAPSFEPAPRTTEADATGDQRTLDR